MQTHVPAQTSLNEYLEKDIHSLKELKGELSSLKDDLVATFDQYFERAKEQVSFLYKDSFERIQHLWSPQKGE